ncbi:MAG: hypothetical protein FWH22_10845 [Fibromonadales bacterium]|nr:hypothetical protein [Fibromonadales bacterium]
MHKSLSLKAKSNNLLRDIRQIIEQARMRVAVVANSETTLLYWHIGEQI